MLASIFINIILRVSMDDPFFCFISWFCDVNWFAMVSGSENLLQTDSAHCKGSDPTVFVSYD